MIAKKKIHKLRIFGGRKSPKLYAYCFKDGVIGIDHEMPYGTAELIKDNRHVILSALKQCASFCHNKNVYVVPGLAEAKNEYEQWEILKKFKTLLREAIEDPWWKDLQRSKTLYCPSWY